MSTTETVNERHFWCKALRTFMICICKSLGWGAEWGPSDCTLPACPKRKSLCGVQRRHELGWSQNSEFRWLFDDLRSWITYCQVMVSGSALHAALSTSRHSCQLDWQQWYILTVLKTVFWLTHSISLHLNALKQLVGVQLYMIRRASAMPLWPMHSYFRCKYCV